MHSTTYQLNSNNTRSSGLVFPWLKQGNVMKYLKCHPKAARKAMVCWLIHRSSSSELTLFPADQVYCNGLENHA